MKGTIKVWGTVGVLVLCAGMALFVPEARDEALAIVGLIVRAWLGVPMP